jgi:YidC/Oxa1 family membrane protein insertase
MIIQTKMFAPPATTPEMQFQQKMMTYMMVFFGFLFYKMPSGLCVYFLTSGLWSLAERKLLPKPASKPSVAVTATEVTYAGKPDKPSWIQPLDAKKKGKPKR